MPAIFGRVNALNRESYDAIAPQWDAARRVLPALDRAFVDVVLTGLGAGDRLLDLGCGTGRPIAALALARGLSITGIDHSAAMLDCARRRFPAGEWILGDLETAALRGPYAGAVLWDVLFHLPRSAHEAVLGKVLASLRPGAHFALSVGGSAHPAFTDTMFGHEFFYDSHPPTVVAGLLRQLGAGIERQGYVNPPTAGRDKGRYAFVVRRPG